MPIPATASDAELIGWAQRGRGEAIGLLVERYSPRLYRYLLRLAGEPAQAEDLLQDTWLRVVERLDRYDPGQPFVVWLFAVARHRAIDILRQRARTRRLLGQRAQAHENEEGEALDPLDQVAADAPSPLESAAQEEIDTRVAELFGRLPVHYREVLALRFQHEMRLDEVSQVLRLPLSTVKTRVQRGLALLRQRVEGLGLG
ncbi:MAG: RNA polymerase sigma factor [Terriglobia bacterium]